MFAIRPARPEDLNAVRQLLQECELPTDDLLPQHLAHFIVLRQTPRVVGCIGIEPYGRDALLRSLAVDPMMRGDGFAQPLLNAIEAHARDIGISTLYLLTTSAAAFFERHGYQALDRAEVPQALQAGAQFSGLCPASATCMAKSLI